MIVRNATFGALLVAGGIGLASVGKAQLAPGLSGRSSVSYMSNSEAMREVVLFGRCFAKQSRNEALTLIATRPTSVEEARTYAKMFRRDDQVCLAPGTSLSAPLAVVRGAIAEGLYLSGEGLPAEYMLPVPSQGEVRNLSDAARCYAGRHPVQVRTLLATEVGSQEEYQAVTALMGDLTKCIPPGAKPEISSIVIRFRLAEAMLRLAPATVAAQAQ